MIYFLIFPLWLVGLLLCGLLALFKPARVLAVYLSLTGTCAVLLSFLISTFIVWAPGAMGLTVDGAVAAIMLAGGYIVGVLGGGVAGAGLGALLAWRLTGQRALFGRLSRV